MLRHRSKAATAASEGGGGAGWKDIFAEAALLLYWQPKGERFHTLLLRVSGDGGWAVETPFQLTLGGRTALRGYRGEEYPGAHRLLMTLEDRIYLPSPSPGLFDLGLAFFLDVGNMWAGEAPFGLNSGWVGHHRRGCAPCPSSEHDQCAACRPRSPVGEEGPTERPDPPDQPPGASGNPPRTPGRPTPSESPKWGSADLRGSAMVMETPPELLILLPLALAAGLDLYLTLLTVGAAISLGLGVGTLGGSAISLLQGAPMLLGMAALFIAEATMESRSVGALLWHNLQLFFRPFGASLLGLFLLQGEGPAIMILGAAMAGVVAAFSHVLYWGQSFLLRLVPDQRLSPLAFTLAGDLATVALLALTLVNPNLSVLLGTLLLLLGLILGRSLHGAVRFGLTLFLERVWGIVSPTVWQTDAELPAWIQEWTDPDSLNGAQGRPGCDLGRSRPSPISRRMDSPEKPGALLRVS